SSSIRPPSTPTLFPYTTLFRSGPPERLGHRPVVVGDERQHLRLQVLHRREAPALQHLPRQDAEPDLDLVHPRGMLRRVVEHDREDRKSTRLNSSHVAISYAVFC